MSILRTGAACNALLVTRGHPFDRNAFFGTLDGFSDIVFTHVEHPAAQAFFSLRMAEPYDAIVCYDMPGIEFTPQGQRVHDPPEDYQKNFLELLERGQGFVFLHHAIAGWPSWPEYAEIVGGRFHYAPAELRGQAWPDSGYRHEVLHRATPHGEHPVLEGLQDGFEIEDELYLCPIFESDVTPLLRSDASFVESEFYSAAQAIQGRLYSNEGWSHPKGSNLIAWTHRYRNSPIVYIACGDSPDAYATPGFQRLLQNAIRFVAA